MNKIDINKLTKKDLLFLSDGLSINFENSQKKSGLVKQIEQSGRQYMFFATCLLFRPNHNGGNFKNQSELFKSNNQKTFNELVICLDQFSITALKDGLLSSYKNERDFLVAISIHGFKNTKQATLLFLSYKNETKKSLKMFTNKFLRTICEKLNLTPGKRKSETIDTIQLEIKTRINILAKSKKQKTNAIFDKRVLYETLYSQLDRGQLKDLILTQTGKRPQLSKPNACEKLVQLISDLPTHNRHKFWPQIFSELYDWKSACDDLDIKRNTSTLRDYLIGSKDTPKKDVIKNIITDKIKITAPLKVNKTQKILGENHIETLKQLINTAKKEILIVAYVLGPGFSDIIIPLENAASRGIIIKLFLDGRMTNRGQGKKNKKKAKDFPESFIVTYGRIHAKFSIIDMKYILLGSSNLDSHFAKVYQANILINNPDTALSLISSLDTIPSCE